MGFIQKLFGAASKDEIAGASLGGAPAWSATPIKDAPAFFRALPGLLPSGAILYLEDICSSDGIALANRHRVEPLLKLALGTIWPRPNCFHIAFDATIAKELTEFTEHHATPELAVHIHAYHSGRVLLEWHDAFGAPLRISASFPESSVSHFCELLRCNYELESA